MTDGTARSRRVVAEGIGFPEGPRWHDGALFLSDIASGVVLRIEEGGAPRTVCEVPGRPSGLGWLPDGDLLVVSMQDKCLYRVHDDGTLSVHASAGGLVAHDLNDMVVDGAGWAYVGNFGYGYDEPEKSTGLVVVSPQGEAAMVPAELYRPNGMAITADGGTLVVAETRWHRLSAFALGAPGSVGPQRTFAEMPDDAWADGMCLDAEGAAWVADPRGGRCLRVRPGGEVVDVVDTGPDPCIACALGGEDRRTLYLLVGPIMAMELAVVERRGRVEAVEVDVPGAGWP